ncbi:MAG TPA: serine/threonine-protein kinase [Planctomycetaceae bacterium]|nr:serine/threonine-protein kinase [Planctomycetaceae bacterium]
MSRPSEIDEVTFAAEPTRLQTHSAAPLPPDERRVAYVRVPGSEVSTATDLRVLLQRRLRWISVFFLLGSLVGVPVAVGSIVPQTRFHWRILITATPMAVASAVAAGIVWRRRLLSLGALRGVELLLFAVAWLVLVRMDATGLSDDTLPYHIHRGTLRLLASATVVPWLGPILAYGILIPNTWRRCAAVVAAFGLTPLVLYAHNAWLAGLLGEPIMRIFLVELAFWLTLVSVIAIYGSHRIEVLRRQADEARRLGHYELQRPLGSGGMGEVYLAEHALLRRPCAVKLIRPERCGNPNDLRRFEREVRTTATLTHPNTIQIFDYGHAEDGTFYYVMEYLPGLTLEQLVSRHGPLPPARAVYFLRQVCGALREAHSVGLVHRDLKPGNIMICERGGQHDVAKLLDFGLVQTLAPAEGAERLTQDGAITGTPAWMSPEQAAGLDGLDGRSDIYSLGCVAYFLLTGRPPFADGSPVKVLAAHLYEPVVSLSTHRPEVPGDLEAVVLRCLAKKPDERYPDAVSLDQALSACDEAGVWTEVQAAACWRSAENPTAVEKHGDR